MFMTFNIYFSTLIKKVIKTKKKIYNLNLLFIS